MECVQAQISANATRVGRVRIVARPFAKQTATNEENASPLTRANAWMDGLEALVTSRSVQWTALAMALATRLQGRVFAPRDGKERAATRQFVQRVVATELALALVAALASAQKTCCHERTKPIDAGMENTATSHPSVPTSAVAMEIARLASATAILVGPQLTALSPGARLDV